MLVGILWLGLGQLWLQVQGCCLLSKCMVLKSSTLFSCCSLRLPSQHADLFSAWQKKNYSLNSPIVLCFIKFIQTTLCNVLFPWCSIVIVIQNKTTEGDLCTSSSLLSIHDWSHRQASNNVNNPFFTWRDSTQI